MTLLLKWKFSLFVGVLLSLLYLNYFENRAFVELDINVSEKTWFKIYWVDSGELYSEKNMVRLRVNPDKQSYSFYLTDLTNVVKLRIDPHQYVGTSRVNSMLIAQRGVLPLQFHSPADFTILQPIYDIESSSTDAGLETHSTGEDPQFELQVQLIQSDYGFAVVSLRIICIFLFVLLFFYLTENFRDERQFVPLFFAAVFSLILVMAFLSKENVHPDEYVHLDGGEYYQTNWLPPVVDDPEIHHTYSVYGVSRLNSREVSYFFTGKLAEVLSDFKLTKVNALRMFNVLLFAGLLLYLLKNQAARFMAVPLLISPQIWYVFGYCNSDAFAIAVSFMVSCQLVIPDSLLNKFLLDKSKKASPLLVLFLGSFCSLLFLLKKNYIFFIAFLVGYLLWRVLFKIERDVRKQYIKRILIVILVAMSFTGLRVGADYAVNGLDRAERLEQIREKLATPLYKPSTPLEEQHSFLSRKARGETLKEIIVVDRWSEKMYRSAFGMYGYFTAVAYDTYYDAVRPVAVALFALLCFSILFRGGISGNLLLLIFMGGSGVLVAASLYHSWTVDFQTQGRYLFPIVPMLCVLLFHSRHLMQAAIYKLLLTTLFVLSVYSFVFVAIHKIPMLPG